MTPRRFREGTQICLMTVSLWFICGLSAQSCLTSDRSALLSIVEEEPDFEFAWELDFSTVSPVRLAAGTTFDINASTEGDDEYKKMYGDDWKEASSELTVRPPYVLIASRPQSPD
jgi:hypothetical protein